VKFPPRRVSYAVPSNLPGMPKTPAPGPAKAGSPAKKSGTGEVVIAVEDSIYPSLDVEPSNITIKDFMELLAQGKLLGDKVLYAQKLQIAVGGEALDGSKPLPRDPDIIFINGPGNVVNMLKTALKKKLGPPTPAPPQVLEQMKAATKSAVKAPVLRLEMQGGDDHLEFLCDGLQGGRDYMEDRTLAVLQLPNFPSASLFGVLDGHGGQKVAEYCTQQLPNTVGAAMKQLRDPRKALLAAFAQIDKDLRKSVKDTLVGSTCVVCLVLRPWAEEEAVPEVSAAAEEAEPVSDGEDFEVTVVIDRDLDIKPKFNLARRTTAKEVKRKVAALDPSGETKPEELALRAGGTILADSDIITKKMTEIDVVDPSEVPSPKTRARASTQPKPAPKASPKSGAKSKAQNLRMFCAHIGDSRAVLCRQGKKGSDVEALTEDHKPDNPEEEERIKKGGGHVDYKGRVNGGLNLSRAFGDFGYKANSALPLDEQLIISVPEVKEIQLTPTDQFVVMASDGVFDVHENEELADSLKDVNKGLKATKAAARKTLTEATESGDNVSMCIIRFLHPKNGK